MTAASRSATRSATVRNDLGSYTATRWPGSSRSRTRRAAWRRPRRSTPSASRWPASASGCSSSTSTRRRASRSRSASIPTSSRCRCTTCSSDATRAPTRCTTLGELVDHPVVDRPRRLGAASFSAAPAASTRSHARSNPVLERFDTVLIDCPPSLGVLTVNGLTAADEVLIPLQCEALAHRGVGQLLDTIADVREYTNPSLGVRGVIATMFDSRTRHGREVIEDAQTPLRAHRARAAGPEDGPVRRSAGPRRVDPRSRAELARRARRTGRSPARCTRTRRRSEPTRDARYRLHTDARAQGAANTRSARQVGAVHRGPRERGVHVRRTRARGARREPPVLTRNARPGTLVVDCSRCDRRRASATPSSRRSTSRCGCGCPRRRARTGTGCAARRATASPGCGPAGSSSSA